MEQTLGIAHFLSHVDSVGRFLLVTLLSMSLATWYLIGSKALSGWRMARQRRQFMAAFQQAHGLEQLGDFVRERGADEPFSNLTAQGLAAVEQYAARTGLRLVESVAPDEFLSRALRRAIEQDSARLEYGLTVLASVASAAPFVGLFGTVWGIYHALLAIGASGQASLDKVAGPVGEALIMTALGLAVAIPAVLAYNAFARNNRLLLSELDGFAHDLFAFMSTGIRTTTAAPAVDRRPRAPLPSVSGEPA
jgi:biopolymer transport protein ExbB